MNKITRFFFDDGEYTAIEKWALIIPVVFCLFNIPIYFVPTTLLIEQTEASEIISDEYLERFNKEDVIEITMTNMQNYFNGECYSKQTFTKIDPYKKEPRTYTYWAKFCTGDSDFLYDFRLVNEGGKKLKLYAFNTPDDLVDSMKDSGLAFGLNILDPLNYFSKR